MRSYLEELRRGWNAPLNEIRRGANKELKQKLKEKKESKGGTDERKDN
ncbi:MAG: hypothetical protein V3V78_00410 [Candidatus Woesearchaeota archaeon]